MKRMRFLQAVGIMLVLALFVVACGQVPAQEAESSTSAESAPAEQAATSDGPFRVAVVAPSAINDLAFTQSLYDALLNIQQERGEDSFEIAVSEGMFVVDDASAAIRDYAAEGFNVETISDVVAAPDADIYKALFVLLELGVIERD